MNGGGNNRSHFSSSGEFCFLLPPLFHTEVVRVKKLFFFLLPLPLTGSMLHFAPRSACVSASQECKDHQCISLGWVYLYISSSLLNLFFFSSLPSKRVPCAEGNGHRCDRPTGGSGSSSASVPL